MSGAIRERARPVQAQVQVQVGEVAAADDADVSVDIEVDRCVGCLACANVCKSGVLRLLPGAWAVEADASTCTVCRRCVSACPFGAVTVIGQPRNRRRLIIDRVRSGLRSTCPREWTVAQGHPVFRAGPGCESVVPDLAVVRSPGARVAASGLTGPGLNWLTVDEAAVPLVVDVPTSSFTHEDLQSRRELFWRCGVTAYWTVDQRSGEVTVQWSVPNGWFVPWARFGFA